MAYRSSPLNPNARKTGRRAAPHPLAVELKATIEDAKKRALEGGRSNAPGSSGTVKVDFHGVRLTVHDTDVISNLVDQVCKDLHIDNPFR